MKWLVLLFLVSCQGDCRTRAEVCQEKGGTWRRENCHDESYTYYMYMDMGNGTQMWYPVTQYNTVCDEWCEREPRHQVK